MDDSLRACLGELLGEEPAGEDANAFLAERGLGLIEVAEPAGFEWPGRFLGRRGGSWAVLFGVPPGIVHDPGGTFHGPPEQAFVLAPHELASRERPLPGRGRVETIALAPAAEVQMRRVERARAIAGRGLDGDRYALRVGTFSGGSDSGRALTLIEAAAVAGVFRDPVEARRNVVVSGMRLDGLIGRRFRIGEVECIGRRRCEPCAHLQRLTRPGVLRALVHRGGLRADIITDGWIAVGDTVEALD